MATAEEPAGLTPDSRGEGGILFTDPQKIHEDAKLLGQAIRHKWGGIVDPERVKPLIEKGYQLADNATDPRGYASVMKVIQSFAKLEQEELKAVQPAETTTNIQINGDVRITNPDERRTELLSRIAALRDRAGISRDSPALDAAAEPQRAVSTTPAD